jgi:hypothetical protein
MALSLDGTTGISASGNIVGNNISVGGSLTVGSFNPSALGVSGNITGGNILTGGSVSAAGNITGNFILGNGSQLTGIDATSIQNGTANVRTFVNGNVTTSAAGTANVLVVTSTGTVTTGSASATGTITGGNIVTAGTVSATGNVTGGNLLINGSAVITGNLNVQGTETIFNVANLTVNDKDIIVANNVTGGANVDGSGIQAGNPGVATWFYNNATTSWQSNIGITPTANGTLSLGGASNFWGNAFLTTVSITGNVQGGNIRTAGLISATGSITAGGDLSLVGNIVDTGPLTIITTSNGNIGLAPNGTGNVNITGNVMPTANATANIGSATLSFNTIFARATSAQYADLAEMYVADTNYPPGTVVEFGGDYEVTATQHSHSTRVAGIVSTNPSYLMNADQAGEHVIAVALVGRVPCQVTGTITKGDRLVASDIPGTAQRLNPDQYEPACIIGKALEAYNSDQVGTIEVAVGRT